MLASTARTETLPSVDGFVVEQARQVVDRAVKLAAELDDRPVSAFLRRTLAAQFTPPDAKRPDPAA